MAGSVATSRVSALLAALVLIAPGGPARAEASVKPPIRGLVSMGKLNFIDNPDIAPDNSLLEANTHPGVYSGAVLLATWAQLEPVRGHYDFSVIDQGLANVQAYNARYPATPLKAKLRVFAGPNAPGWAKALDGGPISLTTRNRSAEVGHFWSQPYRGAWRALQAALAARYDTNSLLEEVAVSSCASSTAEPFVIPLNRDNLPGLTAAGYSDAAMEDCLMGAIDDYAPWARTAVDYTFNPWRDVASGRPRPDPDFTVKVMEAFRARFGQRGVIANHGLTPQINPAARGVIAEMQALGPPIEFQTRSPNQDWDASLRTAEQLGVTEMEVWDSRQAGGAAPVSMEQLRTWRTELSH